MKKVVASIVSANYLPHAKVLSNSVLTCNSEVEFQLLVVDRATDEIQSAVRELDLNVIYAEQMIGVDFEKYALT